MFNLSGTEVVVILLLALVVLGPEKLPDAIRRFGRMYADLKRMSTGFQQEFRSALDEPMREMRDSADLLRRSTDFSVDRAPDLEPVDTTSTPTDDLPFGETPNEVPPEIREADGSHDADTVHDANAVLDTGDDRPGADGPGPA